MMICIFILLEHRENEPKQYNNKIQKQQQQSKIMQSQLSSQYHFISTSILHRFESKKLLSCLQTLNRLVFLTQSELHIINPNESRHRTEAVVDSENILRWAVSKDNQICILYANGLMQIRHLDHIAEVRNRFGNVEVKVGRGFPQLYWEDEDIYVLSDNKLEVFNIAKKQRKLYGDLVAPSDSKNLLGLTESKLLQSQRILIMHYSDKLTFNIVPIPITELPMSIITRFLPLSSPTPAPYRTKGASSEATLPREYLALILDNQVLKIYNVINMKQMVQITYEKTGHEIISLSTDKKKEFLLVTFTTKKNKVTRNVLYKINTKEYYKSKDYFKETEKFFEFEVEIEIKQNLMLFPAREVQIETQKFIAIDMGHIRHYSKRHKGQILISTLIINPQMASKKHIKDLKAKNPQWVELKEWKDIITSYIEMKNTLDKIDFDLNDEEEEALQQQHRAKKKAQQQNQKLLTQPIKIQQAQDPKKANTLKPLPSKQSHKQAKKTKATLKSEAQTSAKQKIYPALSAQKTKIEKQQNLLYQQPVSHGVKHPQEYKSKVKSNQDYEQQMQLEYENYQKLKNSLIDGANIFKTQQNQVLQFEPHEDHDKRIQEEFYKFMNEYLKSQQFDIDQGLLFKKGNQIITDPRLKQLDSDSQRHIQKQELSGYHSHGFSTKQRENQQGEHQLQLERKRGQKASILGSKSSEQLNKGKILGTSSSFLNRTKSSAKQQFETNLSNYEHHVKTKNQSVSEFSENKQQIVTKSNQSQQIGEHQEHGEDSELDIISTAITQAITTAFAPLQNKMNEINARIQRTDNIHVGQLRRCQQFVEKQSAELSNLDMTIKGYCTELLSQFDKNLQLGLRSYWQRIQDLDKKAARDRDKSINSFGVFIDQQIKSREQIFDHSRFCIENSLTHLRNKMEKIFKYNSNQVEEQELDNVDYLDDLDEMDDPAEFRKLKRFYRNQGYGFDLDIEHLSPENQKSDHP